MAHVLIIYAHPHTRGFSGAFLSAVTQRLDEKGVSYDVLDLYRMGFDPVLKEAEHYTSGGYDVTEENRTIQQKITQARCLIFIYPTWWQNVPAIMKGFADRIFTSRFAFRYEHNVPIGLLKGRRAAVLTSAGGPRIYTWLFTGDRALRVMVRDLLRFCGITAKGFAIGGARTLTDKKKKKITRIVDRAVKYLGV
jgi:NAD(P)H dehydrogenase (quinone)